MGGFRKAQRKFVPFKGSIQGASGAGKTYSALNIMTSLIGITSPGKGIAFIDTEKSAELYSPPFEFAVDDDFGEGNKLSYDYKKLIEKLENARRAGEFGGVIIDSMTHFWKEKGGFTSRIDAICDQQRARGGKGDSFAAWKEVDPMYRELMTYIRQYPLHIIMCIRAKQAYEDVVENGKKKKIKVGMEPEFRDGFEYEMDAQFSINHDHVLVPLKHRLGSVLETTFKNPGHDVAIVIADWLAGGAQVASPPVQAAALVAESQASSAFDDLMNLIEVTNDLDRLRNDARASIKKALDDKQISLDQYKQISAKWAEKGKALAAAAKPTVVDAQPNPEERVHDKAMIASSLVEAS